MRETIGLILLSLALVFLFAPEHLGKSTRAVIDGYHGKDQPHD